MDLRLHARARKQRDVPSPAKLARDISVSSTRLEQACGSLGIDVERSARFCPFSSEYYVSHKFLLLADSVTQLSTVQGRYTKSRKGYAFDGEDWNRTSSGTALM
jgi:hypothetical protein